MDMEEVQVLNKVGILSTSQSNFILAPNLVRGQYECVHTDLPVHKMTGQESLTGN